MGYCAAALFFREISFSTCYMPLLFVQPTVSNECLKSFWIKDGFSSNEGFGVKVTGLALQITVGGEVMVVVWSSYLLWMIEDCRLGSLFRGDCAFSRILIESEIRKFAFASWDGFRFRPILAFRMGFWLGMVGSSWTSIDWRWGNVFGVMGLLTEYVWVPNMGPLKRSKDFRIWS